VTKRRWALDVGLVAAIVVVSQLEIWAPHALIHPTHLTGPRAAVSAAYLLAALALVLRTRWPLGAVALMCLVLCAEWIAFGSDESFGTFLLLMLAAYSVAANADRPHAAAGLGLLLATGLVFTASDPTIKPGLPAHLAQLVWVAPAGLLWLTGVYVRRHRLGEERRAAAAAGREREERASAAVAEERARIARELHDAVGHSVSVMTVQASAVRRLLTPEQKRELEALTAVERTGREALAEMRRMVGVLRDPDEAPALSPQPGLGQLDRLLQHVRDAGLPVELRTDGEPAQLPPGLDLTAYRLVQEGLTNAIKHARAEKAEVLLRFEPKALEIVVTDDGQGTGVGSGDGHGLIGMRERVSVYGGELSVGPRDEGGFELRARLPLGQP
jgi:signal transduction histidine kinase